MGYIETLREALRLMDTPEYNDKVDSIAYDLYGMSQFGRRLFVAGNGGSSAIASHFVADMMKTSTISLSTVCLSDNVPLLTALSNDVNYEEALAGALTFHQMHSESTQNDMLIVISSSGRSHNIVNLLERSRNYGMKTVALVGFHGGPAKDLADTYIHVKSEHYGVVEDCHHAIMHDITDRLRLIKLMR